MKFKSLAFIFTVLLCTLCLILSSCTKTQDNKNNSEDTKSDITYEICDGDPILGEIHLDSYSEYLSYIENHEIDDKFITFDRLSTLGTFHELYLSYYTGEKSPYSYGDFLSDSIDNIIGLIIQYITDRWQKLYEEYSKNDIAKNDFNFINRNDMRALNEERSEHYVYDGFIYYYDSGKLAEIRFESNGIIYTIYPSISYFIKNEEILLDPPLSKLLNLDTAKEGRDEIIQLIKG